MDAAVASDLVHMYKQYAYWRSMLADLMETDTYVAPVPGNHEMQCKACGKKALLVNENAWCTNMGDLILDNTRMMDIFCQTPGFESVSNNGPADGLRTDQSKLSYSFDFRGSHFVIINTDPVGDDAHALVTWLSNDPAITMGCGDECPYVKPIAREDWKIPDPNHLDTDQFREVRELMENKVAALIEKLKSH